TLAACNLNTIGQDGVQSITGVPQVRIAAPVPNATFLECVPVNIRALISNAGADINHVEVAVDQTIVVNMQTPNTAGAPSFSISQAWTAAGVGSHAITVTAFRADGSANDPVSVTITVVSPGGGAEETEEPTTSSSDVEQQAVPRETQPPTDTPEPTNSPEPEATSTPSVPMATFTTGVNVRRGPDTVFEPPIGSFAANQTAEIVGINPSRTWYKVKYYNSEGWVFANLLTTSGDTSNLPVDPGPPTPIPATATFTPVPATATPQTSINLVAGNIRVDPGQPSCKQTFSISFDVANFGTTAYGGGVRIAVEDTANGLVTRTEAVVPALQPNETKAVSGIRLTVDTNFETEHTLALIIDPAGEVAETNEGDNRRDLKYVLKKGSC
ncbi:MAG: SH3 domain-containing protein, partial [Anaerolineae bacterium]|nr:SH3 domain-containing protein [Anaerolineae bacterium]